MPVEDYTAVGGGGALRLKGAKIQKSKKKKKKDKTNVDKVANLDRELSATTSTKDQQVAENEEPEHEEAEDMPHKTDAERRHEEAAAKKMQKMLKDPTLASELRKTHKERVEGLNTYLSKLSEHHDMPKIGPG